MGIDISTKVALLGSAGAVYTLDHRGDRKRRARAVTETTTTSAAAARCVDEGVNTSACRLKAALSQTTDPSLFGVFAKKLELILGDRGWVCFGKHYKH